VDEADEHPARDQRRLDFRDGVEEGDVGLVGVGGVGMMAGDGVIGEATQQIDVLTQRGVLERSDAQMARRDPGEHGAALETVADDLFTSRHDGERASGRDPQGVHRLADQVFAQHRAERSAAVSATCERCRPGSLQVEVTPSAFTIVELAEQQCPPVTQAGHESAELMAGVRLS
jgi:hypothetical protein